MLINLLAMETAALWKQWKNQTTVFPLFPQRAWKTRQTTSSFPQFPQPLLLVTKAKTE